MRFSAADPSFVWQSVFGTLASLAPRFLAHQKAMVNLFLLFLRDHYFAKRPDDPFTRVYEGNALILTPDFHCIDEAVSVSECNARLITFLRLFQGLGMSVRSLYAHSVLRSVFYALLLRPESEIQKLSVEILCNDLPETAEITAGDDETARKAAKTKKNPLDAYREQLIALCEDRTFRERITTFFISPEEGMVQKDDRPQFIPIVSRLLYGRLVSRQAVSKSNFASRQSAVLFYLSTIPSEELNEFVSVTTASFYQGDLTPHPRSGEDVDALVEVIRRQAPSLRRMKGLLTLMYEIIRHLGMKLAPYVHVYLAIIAYTLRCAFEFDAMKAAKQQEEKKNQMDETNETIENDKEIIENEDETGEKGMDLTDTSKQTTELVHQLRTLALRRLTECIGHYPAVNFTVYSHYFFTPLSSLLELLPNSVFASKKPPTLIHLAFIISSNASLYYLYDLQPLLIQQVIACLVTQSDSMEIEERTASGIHKGTVAHQVGHLSMPVAQEIVRILENLLKIDPEHDLFNEEKKPKKSNKSNKNNKNNKSQKVKLGNWKRETAELNSMQVDVGLKGTFQPEGVEASQERDGLEFLLPQIQNVIRGLEYLLSTVRSVRGNFFNRCFLFVYNNA